MLLAFQVANIVEAAKTITWPGAFVLVVLIIVVGWVLVRIFG